MKIVFWDREMVSKLSEKQKEMWFDVYNHELEMDRGYNIDKMSNEELIDIKRQIKKEYFDYLDNLGKDNNFQYFTLLMDQYQNILSLCRLIKRGGSVYIGGLETHRNHRNNGYASHILSETVKKAFNDGYAVVYSVIRMWNEASIKAHKNVGFRITETKGDSFILSLGNVHYLSKGILEAFMGGEISYLKLMSNHVNDQDHNTYFDVVFKDTRYVAKLKSSSKEKTSEIINYINDYQIETTKLFESKTYGYTHRFHIHGRDYWLWVETYKK